MELLDIAKDKYKAGYKVVNLLPFEGNTVISTILGNIHQTNEFVWCDCSDPLYEGQEILLYDGYLNQWAKITEKCK